MERTAKFIESGLGRLNNWMTAALFLAGFLFLADYALSYERTDVHGNKLSDVEAFYSAQLSSHEQIVSLYSEEGVQ